MRESARTSVRACVCVSERKLRIYVFANNFLSSAFAAAASVDCAADCAAPLRCSCCCSCCCCSCVEIVFAFSFYMQSNFWLCSAADVVVVFVPLRETLICF